MRRKGMLFAFVLVIGIGMAVPASAAEAPAESGGGISGLISSLLGEDGVVSSLLGDEKAKEAITGLFDEDGALSGVLPEGVDIGNVLETVGSQLEDTGSDLYQGIQSIADMASDGEGSVSWEKIGGSVEELIGLFSGNSQAGDTDEEAVDAYTKEDLDALLEELMLPYKEADAVMFDYVGERNAPFMDAGDAQIFSKTTGYTDDIEQDVVRVLGNFSQTNYVIEGDQMNMVSGATDALLLTLTRGEDGTFTVTDEKHAEDGEGYSASIEAFCEELGIPVDDFYTGNVLGAYNDAEALAEYLDKHPEIATAEYQGEQKTAEELKAMAKEYTNNLWDSLFEGTGEVTEDIAESAAE